MLRLSKACPSFSALSLWRSLLAAGLLTAPCCPAFADIIATSGDNGLGTRIDRNVIIQVKDGSIRGRNRFHRFNKFDTRDDRINAVEFVNTGTPNVLTKKLYNPASSDGAPASFHAFLSFSLISLYKKMLNRLCLI